MRVTVISPERSVFDGDAEAVVAPAFDGKVGILPRHAPFMTLLGKGELRIQQGGAPHRFTVDGGFLQVTGDVVRIVAEHAREDT
jgi:F-type H+-transporting ATPase subunit epsilon